MRLVLPPRRSHVDRVAVCFSATASFGVSGVLAGLGAATLLRNEAPSLRMLSGVPLLFAAQQAAEGAAWVTLHASPTNRPAPLAVISFLIVALVVWPTWLPLALRAAERDPARRRILTAISTWGLMLGALCVLLLARWPPSAQVVGHHIAYDFTVGVGGAPAIIAYAIPTIVPFFVSTLSLSRVMGGLVIVSLVATYVAQRAALTSVWCFFAAILSGLILVMVHREQPARAPR
jgi:hypothetical protein